MQAGELALGSLPNIREKCLLVKEKWAIVLTGIAGVCYRQLSDAAVVRPDVRPPPDRTCVRVGRVVVLGHD
jgi:hypothetical protein